MHILKTINIIQVNLKVHLHTDYLPTHAEERLDVSQLQPPSRPRPAQLFQVEFLLYVCVSLS